MQQTSVDDVEVEDSSSNESANVWVDPARLEYFMDREGIDLSELAERMGIHYNGALRIRSKKTTSLNGLSRLSKALNCHPFDLLVAEGFPDAFWVAPASH